MSRGFAWKLLCALVALVAIALFDVAGAWAQADASDADRPWAEGVSADAQEEALELFKAGNTALDEGDFNNAEEAFTNALASWNHPAIQYNLALALIGKKGDPIRIYKALVEATRYGEAPLDAARLERAMEYKSIYAKQLATLELVCDEPGTRVTLDGRLVLTGPGSFKDLVMAGEHAVTATKAGFLPINQTHVLNPEEELRVELEMRTVDDVTTYTRRFRPWIPWTIAVTGVVVLGGGGGLHLRSNRDNEAFGALVEKECADGCEPGEIDTSLRDRARWEKYAAYGAYGLGGAAVAVGVVMVFLNQPKKVVDIDDNNVAITPMLTPDRAGAIATFRF